MIKTENSKNLIDISLSGNTQLSSIFLTQGAQGSGYTQLQTPISN